MFSKEKLFNLETLCFLGFSLFLSLQKCYNGPMKTIENTWVKPENKKYESKEHLEKIIADKDQQIAQLTSKVDLLMEQLRISNQGKYSSSREKINPNQLGLFNEPEKEGVKKCGEITTEEALEKRSKKRKVKGEKLKELDSKEIKYDLTDEEKNCPKCGHLLTHMKYEVHGELAIIPSQLIHVKHLRELCSCRHCDKHGTEGTIVKAKMPNFPIPKSFASSSIIANTIALKYNSAIPLHRQSQMFEDLGFDIPKQNLSNWVLKATNNHLVHIYNRIKEYLLQEPIIQADETTMNCLDEKDNKKNYMWLYCSAERGNHPIFIYEYQKSRAHKHAINFLKGYKGLGQSDGYQAYDKVPNFQLAGCLAHLRRYYYTALNAAPKGVDMTNSVAAQGLVFIKRIYDEDRKIRSLDSHMRFIGRIDRIEPIMIEFEEWLKKEQLKTLPNGAVGKALKYSINQWPKLISTLCDGRYDLDQNRAERAIRPFVIGRKNWMHAKSPLGATVSAICYSIVETAKHNKLVPFKYLEHLFYQLPNIDVTNNDQLDALLPWSKTLPDQIRSKSE